ncbi:hypothetical protein A2382_03470 [Candidatus Woesebacteria bacterium RIFOXYB1_FULL_38_16]|uniref:Transcription elongation factor GreA n=1 Tax=Candidatus Woesebacteria bacterium RIFOXYB1_FULL_38_16 TaxID=1802538 RepID=A0A1F8CS70_9BACT|nr:MAG: hypothetical protein A2191_03755 [Candidatus Woesebacteria bacterium RIFOXYA1_FULL_38_9]OGM78926.1 MAG: hypothetical protein A2382_03470 [Candidatus Woesebacteria bacterium RIFOXYB1_FULL_38_16]
MNNHQKQIQISQQGLDALKKELDELVSTKRPEIVDRLERARNEGDLTENSAYNDSKEDLEFLDGRIEELKDVIENALIIQLTVANGTVQMGTKVTVAIDGDENVFEIVGEWEADPINKKISHESPLGKALIGKAIGEQVEVEAPAGKIVYEIKNVN